MQYRPLGNSGLMVSAISFGTWAIGGQWGPVDREEAMRGLYRAIDAGVNFFDTADIYGAGRSEEMLREATKGREDEIYIATKFCRSENIYDPETYSERTVRRLCEASLRRLGRECIDLYQIHCPPLEILKRGDVFEVLDKLQAEGKIRMYGVSVETVEEGLTALQYPGVRALQVIFNIFRQKPLKELFPKAKAQGVGILARLPLASGLLTGKFTKDTQFPEDDHRSFNRDGQFFNVGETFAGLPFEKGVELADKLRWIAEGRPSMAAAALQWILSFDAVSCAIPGFKNARQVEENLKALQARPFSAEELQRLADFYEREVHPHIRGPY
ncbi:MAG: aldo/keto reductase [Limnochordales bacterium]|nr:aldo/keto reductase [Bacillota bacterium]